METFAVELISAGPDATAIGSDGNGAAASGVTADGAPGARAVRCVGEIDMASSQRLAEFLAELLAEGATRVVIDASDVSFLDSTGLRVLVDVGSRLEAAGGQLVVDPISAPVRRVLEITGLLERYARP